MIKCTAGRSSNPKKSPAVAPPTPAITVPQAPSSPAPTPPEAPFNDDEPTAMDLQQGGDSQEQEVQGRDFFMEDAPGAEDMTAEKEAEAMADDASLITKTNEAETPVKDASDATKDQAPEAEASAKDASQSTKATSSSAEAEQAAGKAAYGRLFTLQVRTWSKASSPSSSQ